MPMPIPSSTSQPQPQAQTANKAPATASEIHHALLRPAVLQILRAQGYYSSTAGTVDALTELAGSYIGAIARQTAHHAALNNELSLSPTVVDVRMGLEDCGALCPQRDFAAQELSGEEDTRGVDAFIAWAKGRKNQRIRKVAGLHRPPVVAGEEGEAEERETDYLSALKKKHNRSDQDSKYAGTILGRGIEHGEVDVEGGNADNLQAWAKARLQAAVLSPEEQEQRRRELERSQRGAGAGAGDDADSRPPSSGLSSLADDDVEMMDMGN
ncbi:hypothetical protein SLS62_005291 [Diatrype stigma]|uniref:Bromodomain associated domain-containing protein n=1 Tax=Diatrype stigma TaxID=117547 RepID=A0AAN9UPC8_9PEZI